MLIYNCLVFVYAHYNSSAIYFQAQISEYVGEVKHLLKCKRDYLNQKAVSLLVLPTGAYFS